MKAVLVIFSLIFVFSHVYSQINDSPVIGKNSIQNPQDLNKDTQNKKMKDKREAQHGEDIGGSIGSQSSGSQIGATQLGQKDLLNDNKRKRSSIDESKLPSALETGEEVEKSDGRIAKQGDDETLREKRQELIGYALKSNYLNDIILPYRKKREFQIYKRSPIPKDLNDMDNVELKNSGINLDSKSTQGAMVPMGIPVRLARDNHGSLIEVPISAKEVGRSLSSAEGGRIPKHYMETYGEGFG